ncbi:aldehyde dehydrogenase family protein, partial [Acinetobacter baumannii]
SRVQILAKFSNLLAEEAAQLAYDLSSEMGKPLAQAKNEINGARGRITWMLNNAEKYLSNEVMTDIEGLQEIIVHEP